MQNTRFSQARRFFLGLGVLAGLTLAGCKTNSAVTNLTPGSLPTNPSQIYTISARIKPTVANFVPGSVLPSIVIDGQKYRMTKGLVADSFEFDYQLTPGRTELTYYFEYTYTVNNNGVLSSREGFSDIQRATIVGRYVLSLEVVRGPVGARVSVLGRGFTPADVVYFDDTPVRTVFESPNAISFFVPAVEPNRNYKVSVGSTIGQSQAGTFRVDGVSGAASGAVSQNFGGGFSGGAGASANATLLVNPTALSLKQGQKVNLTFTAPVAAPSGGLLIDITTDIPESVIMPEVVIPAGGNSVTVQIEAGRAGKGSLFARGAGTSELVIPVTVR